MNPDTTHISRRAQTQIDFVIAAGLLLMLFGASIGVILPLVDPATDAAGGSAVADQITADRIAAWIVNVLATTADRPGAPPVLHVAAEPGTLSPVCSVAFFTADEQLAVNAGCPVTDIEDHRLSDGGGLRLAVHELDDQPGIEPAVSLGVETICGRVTGRLDRSVDGSSIGQPTDSPHTASAVSSRVISIDGRRYVLTVWVW